MQELLILAILAGSIVFLLSIPVDLAVSLSVDGKIQLRLELRWLFGLVKKEITRKRSVDGEMARGRRAFEIGKKKRLILRLLRTRGMIRQVARLTREIVRRISIAEMSVDYRVGLGDPADTGLLFGLVGPIVCMLRLRLPYEIRVAPVFESDPVFRGSSRVTLRTSPLMLVPPVARFGFSKVTIKTVWPMILRKWRREEK